MNRPDQPEAATESNEQVNETAVIADKTHREADTKSSSFPPLARNAHGFDWLAIGVVILIAAFFALVARINAQPATSFVPVAILSATGCGLLVTALRKLRTTKRAGLFEAALGGFIIALFQFVVAITYPGVFETLGSSAVLRSGFLLTWGLVAGFSIIFSVVGAALGHLAFAPLRPLPIKPVRGTVAPAFEEDAAEDLIDEQPAQFTDVEEEDTDAGDSNEDRDTEGNEQDMLAANSHEPVSPRSSHPVIGSLVTILLLGLAPTAVGYVFSAAYDYTLGLNQFLAGPYPTLRLLSTLLPWQVPLPINVNGNIGQVIIFSLLWRIPVFLGNPTLFDFQAIEPLVFNGAALGLLLLFWRRSDTGTPEPRVGLLPYLLMEAALGIILVLPANLWSIRGLEGLLQIQNIVVPIRVLRILDPLTFTLNLITGPLVCIIIGLVLRRFTSKRATTL